MPFYIDPLYLVVAVPMLLLSLGAQAMVKSAFNKYKLVPATSGLTGAEAAAAMLRAAGLTGVGIERVPGHLSDHYDARNNVLRLSPDVHDGRSLAALGVACHEAGHAIQKATKYSPLVIRNAIVPMSGFGSQLGMALIGIGFMLSMGGAAFGLQLATLGLVLFSAFVVFQIVNLPVEFDASARAKTMLLQLGFIHGREEQAGVNRVLNAAAMTYVAATVTAIATLLYYAWRLGLFGGRRN